MVEAGRRASEARADETTGGEEVEVGAARRILLRAGGSGEEEALSVREAYRREVADRMADMTDAAGEVVEAKSILRLRRGSERVVPGACPRAEEGRKADS